MGDSWKIIFKNEYDLIEAFSIILVEKKSNILFLWQAKYQKDFIFSSLFLFST